MSIRDGNRCGSLNIVNLLLTLATEFEVATSRRNGTCIILHNITTCYAINISATLYRLSLKELEIGRQVSNVS